MMADKLMHPPSLTLGCTHPSHVDRQRSDGTLIRRCERCNVLRGINNVTIQGGALSGKPADIAALSASDVSDLAHAYLSES